MRNLRPHLVNIDIPGQHTTNTQPHRYRGNCGFLRKIKKAGQQLPRAMPFPQRKNTVVYRISCQGNIQMLWLWPQRQQHRLFNGSRKVQLRGSPALAGRKI